MSKTLKVLANTDGWYMIKVSCDEGTVLIKRKLEAGVPVEISFSDRRKSAYTFHEPFHPRTVKDKESDSES